MKYFYLILICISAIGSANACQNEIDPKRVVLFIDANTSIMEIDAAKEAACARGETFKLIPYSYEKAKEMGDANSNLVYLTTLTSNNKCSYGDKKNTPKCKSLNKRKDAANKLYREMVKNNTEKVSTASVDNAIKDIAADDVAITSIVTSGHDGGGNIYGKSGRIGKEAILKSLKEAYSDKPGLLAQLSSVLMWGCYTTKPNEVTRWKEELPDLKILAGFHGSGPSNTKPASSTFMKELLIEEQNLVNQADGKRLKRAISKLGHIDYTLAGVYVENKCQKDYYYSNEKKKGTTALNNRFTRFEKRMSCNSATIKEKLARIESEIKSYFDGDLKVPENTRSGALRSLYAEARDYAHCIDQSSVLNGDRVGMLLFYQGVKENFDRVFKKEITAALKEYNNLSLTLDGKKASLQNQIDSMNWFQKLRNFKKVRFLKSEIANIIDFKDNVLSRNNSFKVWQQANGKTKDLSRKQVRSVLSQLDSVVNHDSVSSSPFLKDQTKALKTTYKRFDQYLYKLEPACMDFLEWHEVDEDHMPEAVCN